MLIPWTSALTHAKSLSHEANAGRKWIRAQDKLIAKLIIKKGKYPRTDGASGVLGSSVGGKQSAVPEQSGVPVQEPLTQAISLFANLESRHGNPMDPIHVKLNKMIWTHSRGERIVLENQRLRRNDKNDMLRCQWSVVPSQTLGLYPRHEDYKCFNHNPPFPNPWEGQPSNSKDSKILPCVP